MAALITLSWSAFYLRYAGIAFIGIAGLLVLLAGWSRGARSALARSAIVVVAGVCVRALWMKRNIDLGEAPMGTRRDAAASLGTNVSRTIHEFERWLTYDSIPPLLEPVILVAALAAVVGTIIVFLRKAVNVQSEAREMLPLALVVVLYVSYLVATASVIAFAAIDFRFLSPIFAPSIILSAWVADRAYRMSAAATTRGLIVGVGVAWLTVAVVAFSQQMIESHAKGAGGYATAKWQNSKLIREVRQLDPTVLTVTNDPTGVELFTDRVLRMAPQKFFFGSSEEAGMMEGFVHSIECRGKAKLVWFVPNSRTFLYSLDELRQRVKLTPSSKQRDGVIHDVEPKVVGPRPRSCPNR